MKSFPFILTAILLSGLFSQSCRKGSMWGIRGEGDNATENRYTSGFRKINLSVEADIEYTQDSIYRLEVTGQKNILAILETRMDGSTLNIDFKRNVSRYNKLRFIIHTPSLDGLYISGSGSFETLNNLSSANLDLSISGSGNISIPSVSLQSLSVKISGSGNINLGGGSCVTEHFSISGSGNISADFLKAAYGNAGISGTGKITLYCSETLDARISGSGSIFYRGQPAITSDIGGSGKLVHLN